MPGQAPETPVVADIGWLEKGHPDHHSVLKPVSAALDTGKPLVSAEEASRFVVEVVRGMIQDEKIFGDNEGDCWLNT